MLDGEPTCGAHPRRLAPSHSTRGCAHNSCASILYLGILLRLDDRVDRGNIEDFSLARYAAQYWARRARAMNVSSRIKDKMECLFDPDKPHFATWLWIYDEDTWDTSMRTIRPEKPKAVPLYYAARLGLRDLAEDLIAEHPARKFQHIAVLEGHCDIVLLL